MEEIDGIKYSKLQIQAATLFYVVLVIACITTIAGGVFLISELILGPTGKLALLLSLQKGWLIVIFGALFAGLFFLLVLFYGLFKRGRNWIIIKAFKPKVIPDPLAKSRIEIKLVVYILLFFLVVVIFGLLFAVVSEVLSYVGGSTTSLVSNLTVGPLLLIIGILVLIFDGLCIFVIFFVKNGYYLILRLIGGLEKD
ncbi:MAG: hypothetical protein JW891_06840 [Candidatus Lokiarchaeota archaeon]|nr:hypothetical protein [Candidatus Lokiarchaeota archaeon]